MNKSQTNEIKNFMVEVISFISAIRPIGIFVIFFLPSFLSNSFEDIFVFTRPIAIELQVILSLEYKFAIDLEKFIKPALAAA